jgi:hypothetical protein
MRAGPGARVLVAKEGLGRKEGGEGVGFLLVVRIDDPETAAAHA